MQRIATVQQFIRRALRATVFAAPTEHGLTWGELRELASRHDIGEGELRDALGSHLHGRRDGRLVLADRDATDLVWFFDRDEFRDVDAYQFVVDEFQAVAKTHGQRAAKVGRDVLLARAIDKGHTEKSVQIAIASYCVAQYLDEQEDGLLTARPQIFQQRPRNTSEHSAPHSAGRGGDSSLRQLVTQIEDIISRRHDQRPSSAEPLVAFEAELPKLGHGDYRMWWSHTRRELSVLSEVQTPTATIVVAAALGEAALSFVHDTAQKHGCMTGGQLDKSPKHWSFNDLIWGAKRGGEHAILDGSLAGRCEDLNRRRQRIHAGKFLEQGATAAEVDVRPEEAREAKETLDRLTRTILDWLSRHA
ncbi:MAG: hypothetical protein RLO52_34415 [Sandaracinaceae bacterium]